MRWWLAFALGLFGSCWAAPALAHGMNPGRVLLRIVDDTAYLVATPPLQAFPSIDLDGDHRISPRELDTGKDTILRALGSDRLMIQAVDGTGKVVAARILRVLFEDISLPHLHGEEEVSYVRLERRWQIDRSWGPRIRVQWHGARVPLDVTVFPARRAQAIQDQTPLAPPQRQTLQEMAPGHIFDFSTSLYVDSRGTSPSTASSKKGKVRNPRKDDSVPWIGGTLFAGALLTALLFLRARRR